MAYVNTAFAAVKFGGALLQGRSDKMNANTQAMSLDYQAGQEEEAAMQQADIIRRARDYSVARADAAYAASGVKVGVGSAAEVDRHILNDATHDVYAEILNGQKRANQLRANAKIAAAGGQAQAAQAIGQGTASALQSGYQAYSGWQSKNPPMASSGASGVGTNLTGYGHGGF
jgi:hypothetical protein